MFQISFLDKNIFISTQKQLFNILKPFFNKSTLENVSIYGSNKDEWLKVLLKEIDEDQIPVFYGGPMKATIGDPKRPGEVFY